MDPISATKGTAPKAATLLLMGLVLILLGIAAH